MSDIPDRIQRTLIQSIIKVLSNKPAVLEYDTVLMLAYGPGPVFIDFAPNPRFDLSNKPDSIMQDKHSIAELQPT